MKFHVSMLLSLCPSAMAFTTVHRHAHLHSHYVTRSEANRSPWMGPSRTQLPMMPEASLDALTSLDTIQATAGSISSSSTLLNMMDADTAEALAGPFFGASLFPYLAFLYFLDREENNTPKGVTVGFATCLLFVFLTIPAAIAAKVLYGVSLADSDWLHGSAESLLTITNLVTVVAFRQALSAKEQGTKMPVSAESYAPMTWLVVGLTVLAGATALVPALSDPTVHTPYLGGFMDLPFTITSYGANPEPENALTVATWIIHISSLVEFLVAMGFAWRWADVTSNPRWKGLTWGLLPLHSSGITACTYHLFYNQIAVLVPLQCEFFALEGLSQLLSTIDRVKQSLNPELMIQGIVLTMFDQRNNLSRQVEEDVREALGDLVYDTVIPRNVRLSEAPSHSVPALIYDYTCAGSRAYQALAAEVLAQESQRSSADLEVL